MNRSIVASSPLAILATESSPSLTKPPATALPESRTPWLLYLCIAGSECNRVNPIPCRLYVLEFCLLICQLGA